MATKEDEMFRIHKIHDNLMPAVVYHMSKLKNSEADKSVRKFIDWINNDLVDVNGALRRLKETERLLKVQMKELVCVLNDISKAKAGMNSMRLDSEQSIGQRRMKKEVYKLEKVVTKLRETVNLSSSFNLHSYVESKDEMLAIHKIDRELMPVVLNHVSKLKISIPETRREELKDLDGFRNDLLDARDAIGKLNEAERLVNYRMKELVCINLDDISHEINATTEGRQSAALIEFMGLEYNEFFDWDDDSEAEPSEQESVKSKSGEISYSLDNPKSSELTIHPDQIQNELYQLRNTLPKLRDTLNLIPRVSSSPYYTNIQQPIPKVSPSPVVTNIEHSVPQVLPPANVSNIQQPMLKDLSPSVVVTNIEHPILQVLPPTPIPQVLPSADVINIQHPIPEDSPSSIVTNIEHPIPEHPIPQVLPSTPIPQVSPSANVINIQHSIPEDSPSPIVANIEHPIPEHPIPQILPSTPIPQVLPSANVINIQHTIPEDSPSPIVTNIEHPIPQVLPSAHIPQVLPSASIINIQHPMPEVSPSAVVTHIERPILQVLPSANVTIIQHPIPEVSPSANVTNIQHPILKVSPSSNVINIPEVSPSANVANVQHPLEAIEGTTNFTSFVKSLDTSLHSKVPLLYVFKDFQILYDSLDDILKLCLLCFSAFPDNSVINKRALIYWWIGEGFIESFGKRGNTAESTANEILNALVAKGFIEPVYRKRHPVVHRYRMDPLIRFMVVVLARKAKFFDIDHAGCFVTNTNVSKTSLKACLVRTEEGSSQHMLGDSLTLKKLDTLFNVNESYLDLQSHWFSKLRVVRILQLGRWQSSVKHHIEVSNTDFLKSLSNMKCLRYLSLQGISRIPELPVSFSNLTNMKVLDLRACHNLQRLPDGIGKLKNLTHLDISECYLIVHMPQELALLTQLQVLKGFVICDLKSVEPDVCTLSELSQHLKKLRKLSLYISGEPNDTKSELFDSLPHFTALLSLTITWVGDPLLVTPRPPVSKGFDTTKPRSKGRLKVNVSTTTNNVIKSLENLEKLDLRCFPWTRMDGLLESNKLTKLKKLYIRGGELRSLQHKDNPWCVEILCLKYLRKVGMSWEKLQNSFPHLTYLEKVGCPNLSLFPCDGSGVWIKKLSNSN